MERNECSSEWKHEMHDMVNESMRQQKKLVNEWRKWTTAIDEHNASWKQPHEIDAGHSYMQMNEHMRDMHEVK